MAGGLIQLMSYGYADKVLIGDPQITFFKKVYHKHSLFAIQDHEILAEADINFGSSTNFKLRNYGDLFYSPYLKVTLPEVQVEYEKTIDEYVNIYNSSSKIKNSSVNLILSKLNAILHNYNPTRLQVGFPLGFPCEHLHENIDMFNYSYDQIMIPFNQQDNITNNFDSNYGELFEINLNASDYEKYKSTLVTNGSTDQTTSRDIYYSTFNVNYLTTQLNQLDLPNTSIVIDDYYFAYFKANLFLSITKNYENEFLYAITKSKEIFQSDFSFRNKEFEITNEIDYIISYYYTNMNILYVYSIVDSTQFKLKYIGFIDDYVYSENNFTNVMTTFNNLYDQFNADMQTNKKYYIASGFDSNKKFKITPITSRSINSLGYSLEFDITKVPLDPNIVYFIYPDIKPIDQGINQSNNESNPNYEDYYKLYYKDYTSAYSSQIYETDNLLLPTCVLKYNSNTNKFEKIELSKSVSKDDYIFMYNDVLVYNTQSQKNQYVLINDKLFTINDISDNSYIYSSSIFLEPTGIEIIDGIASINNTDSYLLYSTETSLEFIDNIISTNTFVTNTFTSPYQVMYTIDSDSFYFTNRLCPINFVKNSTINLDSYENFLYNKSELENINIDANLKNSIAVNNINLTINENIVYITNTINSFLNLFVFFQQYNPFQISTATSNLNLTISPVTKTNILQTIITTGNFNGTNYFYNELQDIITSYIDSFLDMIDTYFTKLVRNIYNLKYADNFAITQDTKLMYILSNLSKLQYFIKIDSNALVNSSINHYNLDISGGDVGRCKLYFKPTGTDPLVDLSANLSIGLDKEGEYYCISNIYIKITNTGTNNLPYYLFPNDFTKAKQFYLFMYLLNYSSESTTINDVYLTPTDVFVTDDNFSEYKISLSYEQDNKKINNINILYDSIDSNIILPSDISAHYLPKYYNSVTMGMKTVVDAANITYHYAYSLFMNIKDNIGSNLLKTNTTNNYFSIYNDKKMFENLWHIMQINGKNTKNVSSGVSNGNLVNIANLSTTYNYLTTSINFASIIDHKIINNSIVSTIDEFFCKYIRTDLVDFLITKRDYFNFFTVSTNFAFINSPNTTRADLDVDLTNLIFIKQFYWYLNYLNAIISDINRYVINYKSETLFNCQLDDFLIIKTFFDTSANVFNGSTYKGTVFNLTTSDYNTIVKINSLFNSVIVFITSLLENKTITLEDNQINLYTSVNTPTIYNNIIFTDLTLGEIIFSLPSYYTYNYFLTYDYADIISFYNDVKSSYLNQYNLILDEFLNYGGFSNSYYLELKQFLNFSISDYEKSMDYFQKNFNYTESLDKYIELETSTPILVENNYKYSIVNSISVFNSGTSVSNFISNYFTNKKTLLDTINNNFRQNINILDFLYENVDTIIETFNNFFGYNYVFYSDYKLIYVFLLYFYDTFTFSYNGSTYNLVFENLQDNTSTANYIKNMSTNYTYNYTDVCFVDINNKIKFTIVNDQFFDLSNNIAVGYDYSYDRINQVDLIYSYSSDYLYIINNKIYDLSNNILYTIQNNIIYNLSNNEIGFINGNIYTINSVEYKYKIDEYKRQKLYFNYSPVDQETNGSFIINGIECFAKYNVFYDSTTKEVKFNFLILDSEQIDLTFKLQDTNNTYISLTPKYIRKTLSKTQSRLTTNLSSLFSNVFSPTNNSKTITWINNTVRDNLTDSISNLVPQLLNNCVKNSIFPSKYLNTDIVICSSFNDLVEVEGITSSNISIISDYIDWIEEYNNSKTNINKIVILNITDQTIHSVRDFISENFENKKFNFIPEIYSTYHINSNKYIVQPATPIEDFEHSKILNYNYMLAQASNLKKLTLVDPTIPDYLESINLAASQIKNAIINKIIVDISNEILDEYVYKPQTFFNINGLDVSFHTDEIDISTNSYFIYNASVITSEERDSIFGRDYIFGLAPPDYKVIYDYKYFTFHLEDISGNKYLITTNNQDPDEESWDISNGYYYYKFDYTTSQVLINVLASQIFHPTLFIYEGKINRANKMEFGFNLDSDFNLTYDYRYDLSVNVMSKVISKFNYGIFNDISNVKYYIDQKVQVTPYVNFNLNILTNQTIRDAWDSIDLIEDSKAIYVVVPDVLNVPIDELNQYIILNNITNNSKTIFDIIYMYDVSGISILKLHPLGDFVYSSTSTYMLEIGISNFINLIGTDIFDTGNVLYYWEKFYSGIDLAFDILNDTLDSKYIEKKFTCAEYIDKIYQYISEISLQNNEYNSLFEIPECIFDKKVNFTIDVFRNYQTINTYYERVKQIHINSHNIVQNLLTQLDRPLIPKCSWINYLGHFLVDKISFKIDDNIIEELDGQIIHIYNYLNSTTSKDIGLEKMIGHIPELIQPLNKTQSKTIYIPLPFFFKDPEKALPIISLLYSQLSINLSLKPLDLLIIKPYQTKLVQKGKIKVKLCGSYVYLDTDERTKFSQMRHEYLVSIKKSYKHFILENSGSLKLDLSLPVSEIFWFYLDSDLLAKNSYWNYTGVNYKHYLPDSLLTNVYDANDDVTDYIKSLSVGRSTYINNLLANNSIDPLNIDTNISILTSEQLESLREYIRTRSPFEITNPFVSSELEFNGHKRFKVEGKFSNLVIPSAYYNDSLSFGLNVYNFSRYPKEITHSGALNFKNATNINFNYELEFNDSHTANGEINLIFKTLNVLRIASGIGCLAW